MKKISVIVSFLLIWVVLGACNNELLQENSGNGNFIPQTGSKDDLPVMDPLRPGGYYVGKKEYTISSRDFADIDNLIPSLANRHGIIYFPTDQPNGNYIINTKWPLVVLLHANGQQMSDYEAGIMTHLASWGFVVMAFDRDGLDDGAAVNPFLTHLSHVYNNLKAKQILNGKLALIGHSQGGNNVRYIVRNGTVKQNLLVWGLDLSSTVLLAPATYNNTQFDLSLNGVKNLMVICVSNDGDTYVNGGGMVTDLKRTGIKDYDLFTGNKDLVFAKDGLNGFGSTKHHFQNTNFSKFYITAFLNLYIRNAQGYSQYLEGQKTSTNLTADFPMGNKFKNLHQELNDRHIQNFENNWLTWSGSVGLNNVKEPSTNNVQSPHTTTYLKVSWTDNTQYLEFNIPQNVSSAGSKYLVFDVTQLYDNTAQDNLNFSLKLEDIGGNPSLPAQIKDFAEITFVWGFTQNMGDPDLAKSTMQSVIIPLSQFGNGVIDLSNIKKIRLEFSDPAYSTGTVCFDNIRFSY